ncbi:MAG: hypothetical protein WKG01_40565 [Kofleriaceae bacterium]
MLGEWLWGIGARRAAWDELSAWHAATSSRPVALQGLYLTVRAWWVPADAAPLATTELVGPDRCRHAAGDGCGPRALVRAEPRDELAIAALVAAPATPTADPEAAAGWLAITLLQALHGEQAWGPEFAARVDIAAIPTAAMPAASRLAFNLLVGREPVPDVELTAATPAADRLVIAAGRALRGAGVRDIETALGPLAETIEGVALLRVVAQPAPSSASSPVVSEATHVSAAVSHARARVLHGPDAAQLRAIVVAYRRDPAIADRLASDLIAQAPDAAVASAAVGALFDALADPARARAAWQAAVTASPEVDHLRGLAGAMARGNDPDAALITATTAAAASGDPAVVWLALARTFDGAGKHVHALEAARYAIDLGDAATLLLAIDVAISASRSLGRTHQIDSLAARRAKTLPVATPRADDPTDATAALAAHVAQPSASSAAHLWIASRWNPRAVAARAALLAAVDRDDPRRHILVAELVELAADPDAELARAAVAAVR